MTADFIQVKSAVIPSENPRFIRVVSGKQNAKKLLLHGNRLKTSSTTQFGIEKNTSVTE